MASISSRSSRERPPGLAVWGGLDPFGAEVVARLNRWLGEDPASQRLATANRILANLALAQPEPPAPDEAGSRAGRSPLALRR